MISTPLRARRFLTPHRPPYMASVAQFLSEAAIMQADGQLAEIVRAGRANLPGQGTVEPENPIQAEFAQKMAPMMGPMAAPLGAVVLEGMPDVRSILQGTGCSASRWPSRTRRRMCTGLDRVRRWRVALQQRVEGRRPRPLRHAAGQRLRGGFRRAVRRRAADEFFAPLRPDPRPSACSRRSAPALKRGGRTADTGARATLR